MKLFKKEIPKLAWIGAILFTIINFMSGYGSGEFGSGGMSILQRILGTWGGDTSQSQITGMGLQFFVIAPVFGFLISWGIYNMIKKHGGR